MKIAVLKETKNHEGRVALTPPQAAQLVKAGHQVFIQKNAGVLSGFPDSEYRKAKTKILSSTPELIRSAGLILKVKEPTSQEVDLMTPDQMIFCYLHLAAFPALLRRILKKKITALGYETLQLADGSLPLLTPMSEIAGKMGTQMGAHFLRGDQGGRGILMGGTEKVAPAHVVIIGGGVVGENAGRIAMGMGAKTTILDISPSRLQELKRHYGKACETVLSNPKNIRALVPQADLLIGAVLIPGRRAPILVSRGLVKKMKRGSVIVDVAVDQGGCVETLEVTSHSSPVVVKEGVLHYGVPNIPAAVPVTGTLALTTETFPYIRDLARWGLDRLCRQRPEMKGAINCQAGEICHPGLLGVL